MKRLDISIDTLFSEIRERKEEAVRELLGISVDDLKKAQGFIQALDWVLDMPDRMSIEIGENE